MNFLRQLFVVQDMTVGKPLFKIIIFAIPLLIGNLVQQMYSTVDSIVVGQYIGDNALAAVGNASPALNLLLVLFAGISIGSTIIVSQYVGAKDKEALSYTIGNSITLTFIASLMVMIIGPILSRPLLLLLDTPSSVLQWCTQYLNIMFVGIAGMSYYNILSGVLRGLGDSVSALFYLFIATILNIVLDIVFVANFNLGVAGVAYATAIAQAISAILCFYKLYKMEDKFNLSIKYLILHKQFSMRIINLGVPSGVTQAIFSLGMIVVQSLTNSFGEIIMACNVIIFRVDAFASMPVFSFGTAMTTFSGQNIGAGKIERLKEGAKQGTLFAIVMSTVMLCVVLLFARPLISLFTSTESLITLCIRMMIIVMPGYIAMAVTQCLSGVMRGAGDTITPMWISILTTFAFRIPIAYGISFLTRSSSQPNGDPICLFMSMLISWTMGALLTFIMYRKGNWLQKNKIY